MGTENRTLFNFLPLTDLNSGSTQQVNDYFREIDDSLRYLLQCILDGTEGDGGGNLLETVQTSFQSGQAGLSALRVVAIEPTTCLLYTSPSPRDQRGSRMPSSA